MSHDIRTPMNAIIGLTHLAKDEIDIKIIKDYLYNIQAGMTYHLSKPINPSLLYHVLATYLITQD